MRIASNRTMEEKYQSTLDKEDYLKKAGFEVRTMWECELKKERVINPELNDFINAIKLADPLNPRDPFYGGRTEPISLYCKSTPKKKIKYFDINR